MEQRNENKDNNTKWNKNKKKKKKKKKEEKEEEEEEGEACFTVGVRNFACVITICYRSKTRSLKDQPQTLAQYNCL